MRDLTRRRKKVLGDATRERNRVEKVCQEANVKLSSALSNLFGVSGQWMREALLQGQAAPEEIVQRGRSQSGRIGAAEHKPGKDNFRRKPEKKTDCPLTSFGCGYFRTTAKWW